MRDLHFHMWDTRGSESSQPAIHLHAAGRWLSFLKRSDDPSLHARTAIQVDALNRQSSTSQQLAKALRSIALEWFYMSFHKNNNTKFITADKKLETGTFESVNEFLKPSSMQTRMTVCSNAWSSSISRKALTSSSKTSFVIRFARARISVVLTRWSASLLHATPIAAFTIITRSNIGTLTAIATTIMPTTTNVEQQSALVSNQLLQQEGQLSRQLT